MPYWGWLDDGRTCLVRSGELVAAGRIRPGRRSPATSGGRLLLDSNPLKGLRTPTEKNPTRVVPAEEEYRALPKVSRRADWRFHVALVLAHETGHRIGAIRPLRWCDIDFEGGTIRWHAEHDKSTTNTSRL